MRWINNIKTTMLLGLLMGLCMLIGHLFLGPNGLLIGLLFGGLGNVIAFFYSDKIAIAAMGGREIQRQDLAASRQDLVNYAGSLAIGHQDPVAWPGIGCDIDLGQACRDGPT